MLDGVCLVPVVCLNSRSCLLQVRVITSQHVKCSQTHVFLQGIGQVSEPGKFWSRRGRGAEAALGRTVFWERTFLFTDNHRVMFLVCFLLFCSIWVKSHFLSSQRFWDSEAFRQVHQSCFCLGVFWLCFDLVWTVTVWVHYFTSSYFHPGLCWKQQDGCLNEPIQTLYRFTSGIFYIWLITHFSKMFWPPAFYGHTNHSHENWAPLPELRPGHI